ncbi:hypothetical protein B0H13DRAFT_1852185 [Mycena leptocephala]|nr:hypothetical protein B0H13DRAFT_1852185 [Mycena leptocephala]
MTTAHTANGNSDAVHCLLFRNRTDSYKCFYNNITPTYRFKSLQLWKSARLSTESGTREFPALIPYSLDDTAYAVAFFIPGHHTLQVMDLSYVLIRFMDKYIRASDYTRFNLLSFSFVLDAQGTFGILILDKKFRQEDAQDEGELDAETMTELAAELAKLSPLQKASDAHFGF